MRGDFATVAESEVELTFALGVGRWRPVVPLVGEPAGVERREEADCVRWVRDETEARRVVVDAERELLDPLGYGVGRDSERAEGIEVPEGTGGVRGRSSAPGRATSRVGAGELCRDWARRPPSFVRLRCCPSGSAIPWVFYHNSVGVAESAGAAGRAVYSAQIP